MDIRRGRLGRRIEIYAHQKYGGNVPIYLDVGKAVFSGVIGDTVLQNENLYTLKKLIDAALANQSNLEWIGVIEIGFGWRGSGRSRDEERNCVDKETQFKAERYWIAQKIDGHWISSKWDDERWPTSAKKPVIEVGDRLERSQSWHDLDSQDSFTRGNIPPKTIKLPHIKKREDRDDNPVYYIAYDDALWAALLELAKRLEGLQDNIIELLGSTERRNRLAAQMQHLLPQSTEKKK